MLLVGYKAMGKKFTEITEQMEGNYCKSVMQKSKALRSCVIFT
jgi:hypothetical protein